VKSRKMLNGCRALDLTDENGFLCGKILADLGVDVIKIEKPGGDGARRLGPFLADIPEPEKSLYWFAYNSNKRGITLNIESQDGSEIFRKLVNKSDFVIESFQPGYLNNIGLSYEVLKGINQGIILTSISAFGQSGPYRDYQTTDLITMGMAGFLNQTGDPDRPPLQMSMPQACLLAGADAAVGTMIAYFHRERTGTGQQVDVSMQQSAAWFLANTIPVFELNNVVLKRSGIYRLGNTNTIQRQVWKCKDGYVFYFMMGGKVGAKTFQELVTWMDEERTATEFLLNMDWNKLDMGNAVQETVDQISKPIEKFFLTHTREEIAREAGIRHMSICPLSNIRDLLTDKQLKARNFWVGINHPELKTNIIYPGEFIKSSIASYATRTRAPLIGEHNEEVYSEIGITKDDLVILKESGII
jgi:crotonobetainyl-CoA:carnitine CoA-transferase CaiB-like acyl-CoA transferase